MTLDIRSFLLRLAVVSSTWGTLLPGHAGASEPEASAQTGAARTAQVAIPPVSGDPDVEAPPEEPTAADDAFHTPDYTLHGLSARVGDPHGEALDPDFSLVELLHTTADFDPAEPLARNARRPFEREGASDTDASAGDDPTTSRPARVAIGLDRPHPDAGAYLPPRVDTRRHRHPGHAEVASSIEQTIPIADSETVVTSRLDAVRQEQADGMPGMRVLKPGMRMSHRMADGVELNGQVAVDHFESRNADSLTRLRYDTALTLRPSDMVRVDIGANHAGYDDVGALRRGVTANYANVAVAVTPSRQLRSTLRVNRGFYSDGNLRDLAQFEAERHALDDPNLWLGARVSYLDYAKPFAVGFYNPQRVGSAMATVRVDSAPGGSRHRFGYGASAAYGRELIGPAGERSIYDLTVQAAWRVARGTSIEARIQALSARAGLAGNAGSTVIGATFRHEL